MGWAVHLVQDDDLASELFQATCQRHLFDPTGIVLHSDNGGPMKGGNDGGNDGLERLTTGHQQRGSISTPNRRSKQKFTNSSITFHASRHGPTACRCATLGLPTHARANGRQAELHSISRTSRLTRPELELAGRRLRIRPRETLQRARLGAWPIA